MKVTKEELIIQLTKSRQSHDKLVFDDENRRKEFAKAFGWFEQTGYNSWTKIPRLPTWQEIYIEVGKLLQRSDFRNLDGASKGGGRKSRIQSPH